MMKKGQKGKARNHHLFERAMGQLTFTREKNAGVMLCRSVSLTRG